MSARIDLIGKRFGRLTVIALGHSAGGKRYWSCSCDCGQDCVIVGSRLRRGETQSCGCLQRELMSSRMIKHGNARKGSKTPTYKSWMHMIRRCTDSNNNRYQHYGERGIAVCDKWRHSFDVFLADMGERPTAKHSIDRHPDPNGNYEPGNCRWATSEEQQNNKRNNRCLTFNGRTLTITQWARELGVSPKPLYDRVRRGWTAEKTLTQPITETGQWTR